MLKDLFETLAPLGYEMIRTVVSVTIFKHQPEVRHHLGEVGVLVALGLVTNCKEI